MGLTIHYNGRFKKNASLFEMIEEVRDIAETLEWKYTVHQTEFPDSSFTTSEHDGLVYGIIVVAPQCEPLWLSFLSNGEMSSVVNLKLWGSTDKKEEKRYLKMLSTKTQYAGVEIHKTIVHLLKHLNKKYFGEFKVFDETGYWETGDEELLKERFKEMNFLLDQVWFGLKNFPKKSDEGFEDYFERLLGIIHRRR